MASKKKSKKKTLTKRAANEISKGNDYYCGKCQRYFKAFMEFRSHVDSEICKKEANLLYNEKVKVETQQRAKVLTIKNKNKEEEKKRKSEKKSEKKNKMNKNKSSAESTKQRKNRY